jgi:hypothetical protein
VPCVLINQYSTGLFVSYSVKNPIAQNIYQKHSVIIKNDKVKVVVSLDVVKLMYEILYIFTTVPSIMHRNSEMCCSIKKHSTPTI